MPTTAPFIKQALLGGEAMQQFEDSFARMGYAYIQDRAPDLLEDMAGFQVVDRNDNNTRAMGVFGFAVGTAPVLVPVFFDNGELNGHEILYLPQEDRMLPLKDGWIEYIRSRSQSSDMGKGAGTQRLELLGLRDPSFREFGRRTLVKAASEAPTGRVDWNRVFGDFGPKAAKCAADWFEGSPELREAFDRRIGWDPVAKLRMKQAEVRPQTQVSSLLPTSSVQFVLPDDDGFADLPQSVKTAAAIDGVGVVDRRVKTSKVAKDTPVVYTNPNESGVYEMIVEGGNLRTVAIFLNTVGNDHSRDASEVLVVSATPDENGTYARSVLPKNLLTVVQDPDAAKKLKSWCKKIKTVKNDIRRQDIVMAVTPDCEATCAFRINGDSSEEFERRSGSGVYSAHPEYNRSYSNSDAYATPCGSRAGRKITIDYDQSIRILPEKYKGSALKKSEGVVRIPPDAKVILLHRQPSDEESSDSCQPGYLSERGESSHQIRPASELSVKQRVFNNTAEIKLAVDAAGYGLEASGEYQRLTRPEAVAELVGRHGVSRDTAAAMLDETLMTKRANFRIAHAAGYPRVKEANGYLVRLGEGRNAPSPEETVTYEQAVRGGQTVTTQPTQTHRQEIESEHAGLFGMEGYDEEEQFSADPQVTVASMQADAAQNDEGFEVSMLASLLRGTRRTDLIDKYLPDLMKGLDRLARILYLSYWHKDAFEERYGNDDLDELRESLKSALESAGDVTLFLKQKSVAPDAFELSPTESE